MRSPTQHDLSRRGFMKLLAGSCVLVGSTSLLGCARSYGGESEKPILRIGMECAYAPYNWQTVKETEFTVPIENVAATYADGYDIQISKMVCKGLNAQPLVVKLPFTGLIGALTMGQIDLIIGGMTATPTRAQTIAFSDPYFTGYVGLLVRKDSPYRNATSLDDFKGASILGQKGTLLDDVIDEVKGVKHLPAVDSVPTQVSRLKQGTCDAISYSTEDTRSILNANPSLMQVKFAPGKGFPDKVDSNVGLRKKDVEMLHKINKILSGISYEKRLSIWEAAEERRPR